VKALIAKYPALPVAVFTLCWAIVEVLGSAANVSAYQVVWTRYGVHLAFMLLVFGPRHGSDLVRTARPGRQVFASLLMLGMALCFIWALQRMSMQDAFAALWLAPAMILVISAALRRPVGGMRTVIATAVGLVGAILMCAPDAGVIRRATVLALGAALCLSLYTFVVRSMPRERIVTKLFHTALWVWVALTFALPTFWRRPTIRGMVAMSAIGLLGWIGLLALDLAIEATPVGALAPVLYTELVWAAAIAWFMGQPLGRRGELGAVLVVGAAVMALVRRRAPVVVGEDVEAPAITA
jgi:drug/metabolite transporter (DMT)-like permease